MKAVVHLLTIVAATLIGGVCGSAVKIEVEDGVLSTSDVMRFAVEGGVSGALVAMVASAVVVLFGKVARVVCLGLGIVLLGLDGWMTFFGHDVSGLRIMAWAVLGSVLADFVARRADVAVSAAGPVAPQGRNPQSSGESSQT